MQDPTGNLLKRARQYSGMTQTDAAKTLQMSRSTLSAIESGKRMVYAYELDRFARLYQVPLHTLVYTESQYDEEKPLIQVSKQVLQHENIDTKRRIQHGMLKLLNQYYADDVTLKLVCSEIGVSKQTFYNYYANMHEAFHDVYESCISVKLKNSNTYHNWVDGFLKMVEFFRDSRNICIHLYFSSHRDEFMQGLLSYGNSLVGQAIRDMENDLDIHIEKSDEEFMLRFYMHVFMGILDDYFKEGLTGSPEYLALRCYAMMRSHIPTALRNMKLAEEGKLVFKP